jgi:hypothetical protein
VRSNKRWWLSSVQAWSRCSIKYPFKEAPSRWVSPVLNLHCRASQPSLLRRALGAKPSSLLHKVLEVSKFSPHCRPQEGDQSRHHRSAARVNLCNSQTRTSPRTESWHSARLEPRLLPATGLPQLATGCRGICTAEATTRWGTTEPSMLSRIRVTDQLRAHRRMISWHRRWLT